MNRVILIAIYTILVCSCTEETRRTRGGDSIYFVEERVVYDAIYEDHIKLDYYAYLPKVLSNDILTLMNESEQQLYLYHTSDFFIVKQLGKAGDGPYEFQYIIDYKQDDTSLIFLDRNANAIKKFYGNEPSTFHRIPFNVERGIFLTSESLMVQQTVEDFKLLLSIITVENDTLSIQNNLAINKFFASEIGSSITKDGFFAMNKCEDIIYTCYLSDEFYKMNYEGKLIKSGNMLYNMPKPKAHIDGNSAYPISQDIHLNSIYATCQFVYVLSNITHQDDLYYIDCYRIKDLMYSHSFEIPNRDEIDIPSEIAVDDNDSYLYVTYENDLLKYKIASKRI